MKACYSLHFISCVVLLTLASNWATFLSVVVVDACCTLTPLLLPNQTMPLSKTLRDTKFESIQLRRLVDKTQS